MAVLLGDRLALARGARLALAVVGSALANADRATVQHLPITRTICIHGSVHLLKGSLRGLGGGKLHDAHATALASVAIRQHSAVLNLTKGGESVAETLGGGVPGQSL